MFFVCNFWSNCIDYETLLNLDSVAKYFTSFLKFRYSCLKEPVVVYILILKLKIVQNIFSCFFDVSQKI